ALLIAVSTASAQSTDNLPSAPSAVNQPKPAPPPPPPQPQAAAPTSEPAPSQTASSTTDASAKADADQQRSDVIDQGGTTIYPTVNEVSIVFTVTDKHNRYVKDLTKTDFAVLDDQRPVPQFKFQRETDLPLQVGLLIDASNSIRDRFKFEQESA